LSINKDDFGKPLGTEEAFTHIMADAPAVHTVRHKRQGKMRSICSASKSDVASAITVCDSEDMYMTVNAFIAPKSPESYGHAKEKYISRLVACYSDIDNYKKGRDVFDAFGEVARLAFNRHIPQPSLIALSGRGLYLRWTLKCAPQNDGQPELIGLDYFSPLDEVESRHRWKKVLYAQVQNAIFDRLEYLGADGNARDMARVLRAPNSIHSVASQEKGEEVRVQYYAGLDPKTGFPYRYTLPELARSFGVPLTEDEMPLGFGRQVKVKTQCHMPAKRNGQKQLGILRVTDYQTIERTIQPPTQGRRRWSLLFLADSLRIAGRSSAEAYDIVTTSAARCQPPYPSSATDSNIAEIVNDAYQLRLKYGTEKLCKLFGITEENSGALLTIVPESVASSREPMRYSTKDAAIKRRVFITRLLQESPNQSIRAIAREATANGFKCDHKVISRDLIALGITLDELESSLFE
jgi:hypothetical protein